MLRIKNFCVILQHQITRTNLKIKIMEAKALLFEFNFPKETINELQNFYNAKKVTMFKIIGCFTTAVAKQLDKKQITIEERAEFFKSEEYNEALNNFKSNFIF